MIENLHRLSANEFRLALLTAETLRDRAADDGQPGLTDLWNALLIELVAERDRRAAEWKQAERVFNYGPEGVRLAAEDSGTKGSRMTPGENIEHMFEE